jgi:hypothetical protein
MKTGRKQTVVFTDHLRDRSGEVTVWTERVNAEWHPYGAKAVVWIRVWFEGKMIRRTCGSALGTTERHAISNARQSAIGAARNAGVLAARDQDGWEPK